MYETSCQSRFDARYWMLGAGALGRPRGMVWGGRREEGSGWRTHVYLWQIHFDIWQNQYNIVKLNKIKLKKKRKDIHWNICKSTQTARQRSHSPLGRSRDGGVKQVPSPYGVGGETGYAAQEDLKSVNGYNTGQGRAVRVWFSVPAFQDPPWF